MPEIININNVPSDFIDEGGPDSPLKTYYLGDAAGSDRIYVNIDFIEPGAKSSKYHSHSRQEEFFVVLKGTGLLRFDEKMYRVREGDCFAKQAGMEHAHQFINDGKEVLQILDCGLKEKSDIVTYPDESVVFVRELSKVFSLSDARTGWSSDPNSGSTP